MKEISINGILSGSAGQLFCKYRVSREPETDNLLKAALFCLFFLCFASMISYLITTRNMMLFLIMVWSRLRKLLRKKMDDENDLAVNLFPGATNTNLLNENWANFRPCLS